jgi:LmbE family N-acetylglucosaminyl deacetylase
MAENTVGRLTYEHVNCLVIVAHPDDETLWAGGTLLMHPDSRWTVVSLTRRSDPDRAPRFHNVMEQYRAAGIMGDLDDGPEQKPLRTIDVEDAIMDLLPSHRYDLVLTHSLWGEYTRHRRHEEVAKAVMALRDSRRVSTGDLWMFAYEDGGGKYLPRPAANCDITIRLPKDVWQRKYEIITGAYGFAPDSFEAKTTPKEETFWVVGKGK